MTQVCAAGQRRGCRAASLTIGTLGAVLVLAACAPALDWRRFEPEGLSLTMVLPCKPASHQRLLTLAGQRVAWTMVSCTADEHTFAVASADVGDPARVGPALVALGQAAVANVQGRIDRQQPAAVAGMTPNVAAQHWRLSGQLPDGKRVTEQVLVFAHGTRVYQATLIGAQADEARAQPFFEAIQVQR